VTSRKKKKKGCWLCKNKNPTQARVKAVVIIK
jgi:hypothetical protein